MAAGVIRNLTDFQQATVFQHPFYYPINFQENFTEDEEEDDTDGQEVEVEDLEEGGELFCQTKGNEAEWQDLSSAPSPTETTYRLLHFAELINCDIQRYFGRKNRGDDPDSCDIYEERAFLGKCGRERYYADLVKIAQSDLGVSAGHEVQREDNIGSRSTSMLVESKGQVLEALRSQENIQHLGPLAELFDYGLRRYVDPGQPCDQGWEQRADNSTGQILPMCKRRLPPSFWREPNPSHRPCMLSSSCTPDFSDLLANWTTECSQEL